MADLRHTARNLFWYNGNRSAPEWIRLHLYGHLGPTSTTTPTAPPPPPPPHSDGIDDLETAPTLSRMKLAETRAISTVHSLARTSKRAAQVWDSRFPGWRGGLAGFVMLTSFVLIINLVGLLWAATHLDDKPFATITMRSCNGTSKLAAWFGLVINFFGTTLLAASNYCMQCLTSPTRADVDAAHAASRSLRIGSLSWHNTFRYRKRRIGLLILLLLSSLPLLPTYSYAVMSQAAPQSFFLYVWVTSEFVNGASFTVSKELGPTDRSGIEFRMHRTVDEYIHALQNQILDDHTWRAELWENISVIDCMQTYQELSSDRGSVLLVTERLPDPSISSVTSDEDAGNLTQSVLRFDFNGFPGPDPRDWELKPLDEWRRVTPGWRTVYCLAKKVPDRCRLQIHVWFLLVVVILNIILLGCLLRTFWEQRDAPFITMGDAIASFLQRPCQLTKESCLLSESALTRYLRQQGNTFGASAQLQPKKYEAKVVRLYSSISYLSWLTYITLAMLALLAAAYGFNEMMTMYRHDFNPNLSKFWKLGFGKFNLYSSGIVVPEWCSQSRKCNHSSFPEIYNMAASSLPQIIVAMVYFLLNMLLTQVVQLQEWLGLEKRRQALRVTTPEPNSEQTSTYWLSLPYTYSIPQILSSMMLGWLASQAVFFTRLKTYDEDGNLWDDPVSWTPLDKIRYPSSSFRNGEWGLYFIGYSPLGVACSILFGILIFGASLAIGLRKQVTGMPLGSSNSLVIAAACHPPENDRFAARNQIQWGVVDSRTRAGEELYHCTISSRKVEKPLEGRFYA